MPNKRLLQAATAVIGLLLLGGIAATALGILPFNLFIVGVGVLALAFVSLYERGRAVQILGPGRRVLWLFAGLIVLFILIWAASQL